MKSISSIQKARKIDMGGLFVEQPLPSPELDSVDPFLLIHHWASTFPGGQKQNEIGVGPHPHRGFSPVTLIYKGALHHRDSLGNNSIIHAGGVQWMNAGKGMTHSERPAREIAKEGGEFEVIQVWINTPSKHKMDAPQYIPVRAEDLERIKAEDGNSELHLVTGKLHGKQGPVESSHLCVANLIFSSEGEFQLKMPEDFNTVLYSLDGGIQVNNSKMLADKEMAVMEKGTQLINVNAQRSSRVLILAGLPLNEEVVTYGPFVMNSTTDILKAMRDAQAGKMGILIEEFEK